MYDAYNSYTVLRLAILVDLFRKMLPNAYNYMTNTKDFDNFNVIE